MGDVMELEVIFSIAGLLAMAGWLVLLASPLIPHWSDLIAGYVIPTLLSLGYVTLILFFHQTAGADLAVSPKLSTCFRTRMR